MLKQALQQKFASNVTFLAKTPAGGSSFIKLAKLNSSQAILNQQPKPAKFASAFKELQKLCKLSTSNLILDCIDISHHAGSHAKAAIIRFTEKGPDKTHYRAYNIPSKIGGNDTGSIIFALNKRLQKKNKPPSVILIDGGTQQLNAAYQVENINNVTLLAIKKGSNRKALTETIYSIKGQEDIPIRSDLFILLIKARDEAHRFAIKANRKRLGKSIADSKLDTIAGIGPKRKMQLFKKFHTIDAMKLASKEALLSIPGITLHHIAAIRALS